eukprot:1710624-Alexandrium_andersonii.AAC.1
MTAGKQGRSASHRVQARARGNLPCPHRRSRREEGISRNAPKMRCRRGSMLTATVPPPSRSR